MTAFRQGPTPWYRMEESPRMLARGVERDSEMEHAMRWAQAESEKAAAAHESNGTDFVRDAIQRYYR